MDKLLMDICSLQEELVTCAKKQVDYGIENLNVEEFNAIMDGIKDMAETKYYILVSKAMEEAEDRPTFPPVSPEMLGYTPHVRASGNYRMGYNDIMHQQPYIDAYLHDPDFTSNMRSEYSEPYERYTTAKRHYTETHDMADKSKMDTYAKQHLAQTISTIKDIWSDATPELKQKMKTDVKALMDTMG